MTANDVERKPSQDREVFWGVVFSGPIGVLGEDDVEYPVQTIFDPPMTAHDLQQLLGRHVLGKQEVPHERLVGRPAAGATTRCDAPHGRNTREAVGKTDAGVANDGRSPHFVSVVGGGFEPLSSAALAASGEAAGDGGEELALVFLERQRVIGPARKHRRGKRPVAMQRIGW